MLGGLQQPLAVPSGSGRENLVGIGDNVTPALPPRSVSHLRTVGRQILV